MNITEAKAYHHLAQDQRSHLRHRYHNAIFTERSSGKIYMQPMQVEDT